MSRTSLRKNGLMVLLVALAAVTVSCRDDVTPTPYIDPAQSELWDVIAGTFTIDDLRLEFARMAVLVARSGCANVEERLSGEPKRILVSLTESTVAHRFISPESALSRRMGPGFIGSESALVVAVEGDIESESGSHSKQPGDPRSFVFVEPVGNPEFTTCVVRESPLLLTQTDFMYGSFEFEPVDISWLSRPVRSSNPGN